MSRSTRRVSEFQFNAVVPHLSGLAPHRIENARKVMVDGVLLKDIAEQENISPNAISKLVRQVWETMERENIVVADAPELIPPGWERVTLIAPSEYIAKVRDDFAAYMRQRESSSQA